VGTLAYLAPEVLFGGEYTQSVDIWGFGCVALELVTLDFLWEKSDTGLLGARVGKGAIRPSSMPSGWPLWVRKIVTSCLSESPRQRPSASTLVQILKRGNQAQEPDAAVSQAASTECLSSEDGANEQNWLRGVPELTLRPALALFSSWLSEKTTAEQVPEPAPAAQTIKPQSTTLNRSHHTASEPDAPEPGVQMRAAAVQRERKPVQESHVRGLKVIKRSAKVTAAAGSGSAQALKGAQDKKNNSHAAQDDSAQGRQKQLHQKKESISSVIDAAIRLYPFRILCLSVLRMP
jgi:serine/threonine protein kinase